MPFRYGCGVVGEKKEAEEWPWEMKKTDRPGRDTTLVMPLKCLRNKGTAQERKAW